LICIYMADISRHPSLYPPRTRFSYSHPR
jgi:hypothetical protein